jgi:mannose-6-phosphate isomerase-like protein (cupin superfamily)
VTDYQRIKRMVNMLTLNIPRHVPLHTAPRYWGPGDQYTFFATGAQTGGAYFLFEALVPPDGGPPPHIHHREQESYYILEGTLDITLGETVLKVSPGDFVHIPRGTVHAFRNTGETAARMLLLCVPSGLEKFFEEALEPVQDPSASPPLNREEVNARLRAAGPRHGVEFV